MPDTWLYVDWHFQPAWWNDVVDVPIFLQRRKQWKILPSENEAEAIFDFVIFFHGKSLSNGAHAVEYSERLDMSFCTFPAAWAE